MSDKTDEGQENNSEAPEASQDRLKNLQSEFSRKYDNTLSAIQELTRQNQIISQQLQQVAAARSEPADAPESQEIDVYDPKSVQRAIKTLVSSEVTAAKNEVYETQNKQNVLGQLVTEYPELRDNSSDLSKLAVQVFSSLDKNTQASASGYKLAVREAAAQLGMLPNQKRKAAQNSEEDFVMPSGSGGRSVSKDKSSDELSDATQFWAQALGVDMGDKKKVESIKKRAKRQKWTKWSDG